jgi:type VI secretion system secreted protein VgrG
VTHEVLAVSAMIEPPPTELLPPTEPPPPTELPPPSELLSPSERPP